MKKIFILDDDRDFVELIEMLLSSKYEVRSSTDAFVTIDILREYEPDLIIIDHFIGRYDSHEVISNIRKAFPDRQIPIFIFSGSPDVEKKASLLGAAGYLKKPSSIDHIRTYIDNFLEGK